MASPLKSPPHNCTPFIYFTERLSLVISTALKSYYLYVNDEWIDCGCQEQYLFVSSGQPWLCFNSISPPSLNVIDNWCGRTLSSGGAKFFSSNRRVPCHFGVFTGGALCCFQQRQFMLSQMMTWHWCDPRESCGSWKGTFRNNEAPSVV